MANPQAWESFVVRLEPHVSPEWARYAREHGGQGWIRLILLVDAHGQLSNPRVAEKVAMTMADLAVGGSDEAAGWSEVTEKARDERMDVVAELVDAAPQVLSEELVPLFARSIEPLSVS